MRNMRKRLIITGVIMLMGLGLTGCTKTKEDAGGADGSAVEAEDLPEPESPEDGDAPEENADSEEGGQDADSADNSQRDADISSLRYIPDTEGDLYGDIWEIGDKQFTVTEIYTETDGDGGIVSVGVAPGAEGEAPEITVVYDDQTTFEKRNIWNGGANHEEKEGSAADLQEGLSAEMWGSYEGDVFHATAIRVVEVIL